MADTQQLKTPADAGKGPAGEVKRWLLELDYADKVESSWRALGQAVVKRYRNESAYAVSDPSVRCKDTFNILWSNVETLRPAIYNSTPEPVVQDRFGDSSPVVKAAIEVLRRALKYTLTSQDFDQVMNLCVQDYLLPGRGGARVRYVPTMSPTPGAPVAGADPQAPAGEAAAPTEELAFEEVRFEVVDWDGFRRGHAEVWDDLPWMAFEHELTYAELVERFGEATAKVVPMSGRDTDEGSDSEEEEGVLKTALVYEIWDKVEREVIYLAPDYKVSVLKRVKDEYQLGGFWPQPRMLYAVETSESLVPQAEFAQYETLADDLEVLTKRMAKLARACVVRGVYPADMPEIRDLLLEGDLQMIPTVNLDKYAEMGGLERVIQFAPLQVLVQAYQALSVERENCKNSIYEVMGASDIMRGATQAIETASAQKLKSRWGSVRLRRRQAEIERFCRDLLRLAAELIAEKFQLSTLKAMTGCDYPLAAERDQARGMVQQLTSLKAQLEKNPDLMKSIPPADVQQAQQKLAQAQETADKPAWEEILQLLHTDAMRRFQIDVQTDSTIALQAHEDQQEFAQMIEALSGFIEKMMPLVSAGALPFDAAKSLLKATARRFRLGYEVADELDKMVQPPPPDPAKSPEGMALQAQIASQEKIALGKAQAESALEDKKQQAELARVQADAALKKQAQANDLALQQSNDQRQQLLDQQKHAQEMEGIRIKAKQDQADQELKLAQTQIDALAKIEVARIGAGLDTGEAIIQALEAVSLPGMSVAEQLVASHQATMSSLQEAAAAQAAQHADTLNQLGNAVVALHQTVGAPRRLVRDARGRAVGAVVERPQ